MRFEKLLISSDKLEKYKQKKHLYIFDLRNFVDYEVKHHPNSLNIHRSRLKKIILTKKRSDYIILVSGYERNDIGFVK
jgi:rhodanese-related sulfurtransferase